ncbi:MAG: tetratricopeptide repeat protein [Chitinophagaceae bacterium]
MILNLYDTLPVSQNSACRIFIFKCIIFFSLISSLVSCKQEDLKTAIIQNNAGLALYNKADYKKARYFFLKAASHENLPDTNMAVFFYNIARTYSITSEMDSAKYFYQKSCKLYSATSQAFKISKASIFLLESKTDSARKVLEEGYEIDSTNGTINNLLGLIFIGEYGEDYFNPNVAYKFNVRAYSYFKDEPSKFALAKSEYFVYNTERAISLFSQLHRQYPKNETYLTSLILIKGEKGDQQNLNMLTQELKRKFPNDYDKVISQINTGQHSLRWNVY